MLTKRRRLGRAAFAATYAHSRRVHAPGLFLVYMPASMPRMAAVAGKKVSRTAVGRNRLRRRIYAALEGLGARNAHVIVVAKPPAASYSYERLRTEVEGAMKSIVGINRRSR